MMVRACLLLSLVALLLVAGCGGAKPAATWPPEDTPVPATATVLPATGTALPPSDTPLPPPPAETPLPTETPTPGGLTIDVPPGSAPTLDGTLSPGEWQGAVEAELSDGGELLLLQDGEYLYVGIRGRGRGLGSICVDRGGEVAVLHSSAALGTAVYERSGDGWSRIRDFDWTLRETAMTSQAEAARKEHLQDEGWLANNGNMGAPEEMEYQIAILGGGLRLAVNYYVGPGSVGWWPGNLDDDCRKLALLQGDAPETLQFSPETWATVPATTADAKTETQGPGQIAFYSERDGNAEIYLIDADGRNLQRLTHNDADDVTPAWSPNGARIAYVSDRHDAEPVKCFPECNYELYVMNADGSDQQRLTDTAASESHPAWSPDGAHSRGQIAFMSERDGNQEIYVIDAGGGDAQRLTDNPADDMRPAWSPDGTQILFNSERDGNWELYLMDADGENQRRLTESPAWELFPTWSPDGRQIAFFSMEPGGSKQDVYVMDADGSHLQQLTDHRGVDEDPAWSPDGQQLVFQSDRDGNFEIYVMNADGSDQQRLTNNHAGDYWPAWRPATTGALGPEDTAAAEMDGGEGQRLVIVYDNTVYDRRLRANWGLSAWLEYDGHTILFDTGGNGYLLLDNMEKMGLDPQEIEAIVLSHIHGDHTDGLDGLLRETGIQPVVYLPAFFPASFKEAVRERTEVVEVSEPVEVFPGVWSTGVLPRGVPEQGLVVETTEGTVVITGCAHPGIVDMVSRAKRVVDDDVAWVVGGFHLGDAAAGHIERIIADFRDLGVKRVTPSHCTGQEAIAMFADAYGDDYIEGGVGREVVLAPPPVERGGETRAPWPTEGWATSTPEEQGIDSEMLADMLEAIETEGHGIDGVSVIRNGYLVADATVYPFAPGSKHAIRSCTKSIVSALIGIAIERGYLDGVQQRVLNIFPGRTVANVDRHKEAMTLEDILTMSAGWDCRDSYLYRWQGIRELEQSEDWVQFMLDLPMVAEPGTRFEYCNGGSFLLSAIIQEKTGDSTLELAKEHLFGPLGISEVDWPANPQGISMGWGQLRMQPHDMAKIGYLYLSEGQWDGEQVLPAAWVAASTQAHIPATLEDGYGYQWWTDSSGTYMALGYGGQFIFVVPEREMVVVFVSELQENDFYVPQQLLAEFILPAARSSTPLPENPDGMARLKAVAQRLAAP